MLHLYLSVDLPQPCGRNEEQVAWGLGFILVLPQVPPRPDDEAPPKLDVDRVPVNEGYLTVLGEVSKHFGMRDITEEFVACGCFLMKAGWPISSWVLA